MNDVRAPSDSHLKSATPNCRATMQDHQLWLQLLNHMQQNRKTAAEEHRNFCVSVRAAVVIVQALQLEVCSALIPRFLSLDGRINRIIVGNCEQMQSYKLFNTL